MTLLAPCDTGGDPAPVSAAEFAGLAELLYGIYPEAEPGCGETAALAARAERLRTLGLRSLRDYCRALASSGDETLAARCAEEPRFMAEPGHVAHLLQVALPEIVDRVRRGGSLRIWSAGCGGGHEPYTIAMAVLSAIPDAGRHDVRILASDIDPSLLSEARAGLYGREALRDLPQAWRDRWLIRMTGADPLWQVAEEVRDLVALRPLNLFSDWPMRRPFDLVFCRNVLVPFEAGRQHAVWRRFAATMKPRGMLFAGVGEDAPSMHGFAPAGGGIWRLERKR